MVPAEATQKSTILRVWKKNDEKHEEFRYRFFVKWIFGKCIFKISLKIWVTVKCLDLCSTHYEVNWFHDFFFKRKYNFRFFTLWNAKFTSKWCLLIVRFLKLSRSFQGFNGFLVKQDKELELKQTKHSHGFQRKRGKKIRFFFRTFNLRY